MLLSIENLRVAFRLGSVDGAMQRVEAVGRGTHGVSFDVPENTTVALVGESGSGKSVTAMSILNLLPDNAERSGRIRFMERDIIGLPHARAAGAARQGHRLRLPGPDDFAQPGLHGRAADLRAAAPSTWD